MSTDIEFLSGATNIRSLGFNLIGNGNAAVVFNQPGDMVGVTDPLLSPLMNTGGPTPTHFPLPGSPVIDAGDPVAVAGVDGVPEFDQRGNPYLRVYDGLQDTKDRIDIGAYELQAATFIVDTAMDENDGNISPGFFSLREAIQMANLNPIADVITFDNGALFGSTIVSLPLFLLEGTPTDMRITESVSIVGLGELFLTFDGSMAYVSTLTPDLGRTRFFTVDDGDDWSTIDVTISDVRIQNCSGDTSDIDAGTTDVGGAIKSVEDLALQRISFVNNSTVGDGYHGGAVYQGSGSLTLDDVMFTANSTDGVNSDGGAVYVRDADVTILNDSSFTGNTATQTQSDGGAHLYSGRDTDGQRQCHLRQRGPRRLRRWRGNLRLSEYNGHYRLGHHQQLDDRVVLGRGRHLQQAERSYAGRFGAEPQRHPRFTVRGRRNLSRGRKSDAEMIRSSG